MIFKIKTLLTIPVWGYFCICISIILASCSSNSSIVAIKVEQPTYYDSNYPVGHSSEYLNRLVESVKRISNTAYYKTYIISPQYKLSDADIFDTELKKVASDIIYYNESTYGTSTIIYSNSEKMMLLTCAHIISFPDTIVNYFPTSESETEKIISDISIKVNQHYYINDISMTGEYQLLAKDNDLDIALIGATFKEKPFINYTVFDYPFGNSSKLDWGSFVYIIGFPMGSKMVTTGIVSIIDPSDNSSDFLVDALFNRGFSGGIVLATHNGIPNFELVGLTKSVSSNSTKLLKPSQNSDEPQILHIPFEGEILISEQVTLNYGVTNVVSINAIREFIRDNSDILINNGYVVDNFIQTK
jgi:hypothetical protein